MTGGQPHGEGGRRRTYPPCPCSNLVGYNARLCQGCLGSFADRGLNHRHDARPDRLRQVCPLVEDHPQVRIGLAAAGFTAPKYATRPLKTIEFLGNLGQ